MYYVYKPLSKSLYTWNTTIKKYIKYNMKRINKKKQNEELNRAYCCNL